MSRWKRAVSLLLFFTAIGYLAVIKNVIGANKSTAANTRLPNTDVQTTDRPRSGFEQTISQLEAEKAQLQGELQSVQEQVGNVSGFEQTISQLEAEMAQLQGELQSVQEQVGNASGFEQTISQLEAEKAQLHNCTLCEDDWLFVVGTGRSGSTTVMAMLNLIPSVYLAGENNDVATHMLGVMESFKRFSGDKSLSWTHHHYPGHRRAMLCSLQAVAKRLIGAFPTSKTVIGWKEIRWTLDLLKFMRELFPCAKFVINVRSDSQAQARSGFYYRQQSKSKSEGDVKMAIKAKTELVEDWGKAQASTTVFSMPLEQFSVAKFNQMLAWLGVGSCSFKEVLHTNNKSYIYESLDKYLTANRDAIQCT